MTAAVGIAVVGLALQVKAARDQRRAQNKALEYNAQVAARNAELAELQAQDVERRGLEEQKQIRLKTKALKGAQRASFGASGVLVDEGSAFDVVADTQTLGELDALTAKYNFEVEAFGIRAQGGQFRSDAAFSRLSKRSGNTAAFGTLLTGGARISQFKGFSSDGKTTKSTKFSSRTGGASALTGTSNTRVG